MAAATKSVAAAAGAADPAALQQHLAALQQQFKGLSSSDLQQALAGKGQAWLGDPGACTHHVQQHMHLPCALAAAHMHAVF